MAQFLRDKRLANITANEDLIRQLDQAFKDRQKVTIKQNESLKIPTLSYTIRFDTRGYRLYSLDQLFQHFNDAIEVERLVVSLETMESVQTHRQFGDHLEVRLDKYDQTLCYLSAASGDYQWTDGSFTAILEILEKHKNRKGWIRSSWSKLLLQLFVVFAAFVVSLWSAAILSKHLIFENAFFLTFLFVLLVISNIWEYAKMPILSYFDSFNVEFYRTDKDKTSWISQYLLPGVLVTGTLYVLGKLCMYIWYSSPAPPGGHLPGYGLIIAKLRSGWPAGAGRRMTAYRII